MSTKRTSYIAALDDGRRVRFSLTNRKERPYSARFRGPDGSPVERSTREKNLKRAQESAIAIILEEYNTCPVRHATWDEAVAQMTRHMQASGLRSTTIEQYELAVSSLRRVLDTDGPADVTPLMAQQYKAARSEEVKPRTLRGNIENLRIVYGHWFRDTLGIVARDPFANVQPPKEDQRAPRIIETEEQNALSDWLQARWSWRLPILVLEVKAALGCRITELCSARSDALRDGRLHFVADTAKGREERACRLPPLLYEELQAVAGPTYVFESFSEELRSIHRKRGRHHHAKTVKPFSPARLKDWLQNRVKQFIEETGVRPFKLHNLRGTAMSRARMAGVGEDDAALAFGCNPATMRDHYLNIDRAVIADRVFDRIQNNGTDNGT